MTEKWAVLWDLDGTLVDTGNLHFSTWKSILKPYGREITYDEFAHTFGLNNTAVMNFWFDSPSAEFIEELSSEKEAFFRQHIRGNVTVLPGVIEWLKRFQSWGWPMAIASSAPMVNIEALVDAAEIRPYFDRILSAESMPSKPNPDVFLEGARQLGMPISRCVVFEDAPAGVEGACRASMKSVAVLTTHPAENLSNATLIVPSLENLTPELLFEALGSNSTH
jgi:beta-phosphoglucomutase